ncbi:MAG: hypothetical protein ABSC19_06920 [Syntrophorhabdales bacterium]
MLLAAKKLGICWVVIDEKHAVQPGMNYPAACGGVIHCPPLSFSCWLALGAWGYEEAESRGKDNGPLLRQLVAVVAWGQHSESLQTFLKLPNRSVAHLNAARNYNVLKTELEQAKAIAPNDWQKFMDDFRKKLERTLRDAPPIPRSYYRDK